MLSALALTAPIAIASRVRLATKPGSRSVKAAVGFSKKGPGPAVTAAAPASSSSTHETKTPRPAKVKTQARLVPGER